jgi:uncharacterized repeat protein (TIGR01451 family)
VGDVVNTRDGRVDWSKVDERGRALGGAVFELHLQGRDDHQRVEVVDNVGQPGYTGRDLDAAAGEFSVVGLDFGTWTLLETMSPVGYLRDHDSRQVVVGPDHGSVDAGVFVNVSVWATVSGHKSVWELDASGEPVPSDGTVDFGDRLLYGIDVTARGSVAQSGVTVTDPLPDGLSYVEDSAGCEPEPCTASFDARTATLTWSVGLMEPGEVVTVYFVAVVDEAPALAPGESASLRIDNVGSVSSDRSPTSPTNLVRVEASVTEPPVDDPEPPVVDPTPPVDNPTPVPPKSPQPKPQTPETPAFSPTPRTPQLARTGIDGVPQLMGAAALLVMVGTGLWRVAARREL